MNITTISERIESTERTYTIRSQSMSNGNKFINMRMKHKLYIYKTLLWLAVDLGRAKIKSESNFSLSTIIITNQAKWYFPYGVELLQIETS